MLHDESSSRYRGRLNSLRELTTFPVTCSGRQRPKQAGRHGRLHELSVEVVEQRGNVFLADGSHRRDLNEATLLQVAAGAADGIAQGVAAGDETLARLVGGRGKRGDDGS